LQLVSKCTEVGLRGLLVKHGYFPDLTVPVREGVVTQVRRVCDLGDRGVLKPR
jgi:hypothetical protein